MPALTSGTRLGPYEILDAIGAGGMGEVYRARDTRLDRIVAIKVLASGLASDTQSRERFEREAKTISSLNHPNICVLYDVGRERPVGGDGSPVDESPVDFLVMEYLEGETLTARLARGASRASRNAALSHSEKASDETVAVAPSAPKALPPMTVDEALGVAVQIAAALDRAHRQGIVHRDLKPGNVMLTKSGVKLLDFGLARLTRAGGAEGKDGLGHGLVSLADLSAPTVTSPLTVKGTILGTLQYMAPEQLEGKEVDARADIFAFGGVLYEMLTGRRPFEGKSQASLIGAILDHHPPPITSLQPVSPPLLDEIVARCLAKDPDERWQSARDLKRQLEWVSTHLTSGAATTAIAREGLTALRSSVTARALRVGGAVLAGAAIAGAVAWAIWPKPPAPPVITRFTLELAEGQGFSRAGRHLVTMSPDGTRLVFVSNQQLYLRAMHDLTAAPIAGTEKSDPTEPVFSPDGQWVAFWSGNELRKIPISGGTPVTLSTVENPWGASWQGDRILLGQTIPRGIVEVPANGGPARMLIPLSEPKSERAQSPQLVSEGRAVLFSLRVGLGSWDDASIVVQDLASGNRTVLVTGGTDGRVLPTGHLVYVREATLFAVPFDETKLTVTGGPVPILRGVRQAPIAASGAAQWAWSASGSLAYVPGEGVETDRAIVWVDRKGRAEPATAPIRAYSGLQSAMRLSPDGRQLAVVVDAEAASPGTSSSDIWIWDTSRTTLSRLSVTGAALSPVWTPDGKRVCYRSGDDVLCQAADGSGSVQKVVTVSGLGGVRSFSPDGTRMLLNTAGNAADILMTTIGPPAETRPLIKTTFGESGASISPDGRWVAYQSNESGRFEIYVRPFPNVDQGRTPVSSEGGVEPRWAPNGRELFFATGGGPVQREIWSAAIQAGSSFVAGKAAVVVRLNVGSSYDIGRDGRLLFHTPASGAKGPVLQPQIVVVQNWFDELKARVPVSKQD